jgi:aminopeptidase
MLEHIEAADAFLRVLAEDPEALSGIEPGRVAAHLAGLNANARPARAHILRNAINWCSVSVPIPAWAAKVLPDVPEGERIPRLWDLIFETCRLKEADPIAAWRDHIGQLSKRSAYLTEKQYSELTYSAPGTRLTVGLPPGHVWHGGQVTAANGIDFVPNLPTEEIFTLPHRARVDGDVSATKPFEYGGSTIEGMDLTFAEGQVVKFTARRGEELLRMLLETDAGSRRLGEVALVPHSSPLSRLGVTFHNTLYDENAASHLALGSAYRFTLSGGESETDDAFAERGGNQSLLHCDFMIGSAAMDVDGIPASGAAEPVMRAGEWAFRV